MANNKTKKKSSIEDLTARIRQADVILKPRNKPNLVKPVPHGGELDPEIFVKQKGFPSKPLTKEEVKYRKKARESDPGLYQYGKKKKGKFGSMA